MAGQIILTSQQVNSKKQALQQANQSFKQAANSLYQTATSMKDWEGTAQKAFIAAVTRDKTQMDNFSDLIDRFVNTLDQMVAIIKKAEATNTDIATRRNY